jgi:HlyD family secretion protein
MSSYIHRRLSVRISVACAFVAAIAVAVPTGCSCRSDTASPSDDGVREVVDELAALGRVVPRDGVIAVSGVAGDRIAELRATVGQRVTQGEVLAVFESRSLKENELQALDAQLREALARREAEQQFADARIERAKLALEQAQKSKDDVEVFGKKVEVAATTSQLTEKDLARLVSLPEDLVPEQKQERQMLLLQKTKLELAAAEAEFERAVRESDFNIATATAELAAAEAARTQVLAAIPVDSLRAAKDAAEKQLERTQLVAPADGTVLQVLANVGETVGQTPLLQMANLKQMVVVAEVPETDVKRLQVGQNAVVHSKAFRAPYDEQGLHGTVEQIGRMISTPTLKGLDPPAESDLRVVEVRILLSAEDAPQAAEFVNLQVGVTFPGASTPK